MTGCIQYRSLGVSKNAVRSKFTNLMESPDVVYTGHLNITINKVWRGKGEYQVRQIDDNDSLVTFSFSFSLAYG